MSFWGNREPVGFRAALNAAAKKLAANQNVSIEKLDKRSFNLGLEAAAKLIEELGTNNVGMLHDVNRREAEAIRKLRK